MGAAAAGNVGDAWAHWLFERRHGGAVDQRARVLEALAPVRDRVLDGADLRSGDLVVDVGAGDGMIGFAALDHIGGDGRVLFVDISPLLVQCCRQTAQGLGVAKRCGYITASATHMPVDSRSVDAVTMRSVLIYVEAQDAAIAEAARLLRPGGRLSIFEPLASVAGRLFDENELVVGATGYRVERAGDAADKLRVAATRLSGDVNRPMRGLDVDRLVELCGGAQFQPYRVEVVIDARRAQPLDWDVLLATSPNPLAPTYGELLDELAAGDRDRLVDELRPMIETGSGVERTVGAYVTATRA